jgi:tRNA(fMet)-specific endonuclease VapC
VKRSPTFLLDSTVLIDVGNGREPALAWFARVVGSTARILISTVTVAEVVAGTVPRERDRATRFLRTLDAWPVTDQIAVRAGIFRYDSARQGFDLKLPDAVIAATAEMAGAVLVTANVKDFQRLGLPLLSPSER